LTVFKVTGELLYDEAISVVKSFYEGQPTENVIWDLSDITEIQLTSEQIESIVSLSQGFISARSKGKTAFVAQKDFVYGLSRMFNTLGEIMGSPFQRWVFKSMEEAYQWLSEEDP
jgi:hypothetical protein